MVKNYQEGLLTEKDSLSEALNIKINNPVISVTGAGGKTTLIRILAEEYRRKKIPVIVTTTTHMLAEDSPWFLLEPSIDKAVKLLESEGMVWVGMPAENGKMKALPDEFLDRLTTFGYPLLIEADGAKKLPLKVPAGHEPVIIPKTTHVLGVYGLDAVGSPLKEVCFRRDIAAEILDAKMTDDVKEEDIAKLAFDSRGGKKGVLPYMEYRVVLNKADNIRREQTACRIGRLAEKQGFTGITVTACQYAAKQDNIRHSEIHPKIKEGRSRK